MDAPGYSIGESEGSRKKHGFVVGNGEKIPNRGEMNLKLDIEEGGSKHGINAIFQVAQVTRPLMSVSKTCDSDFTCHFYKDKAEVRNMKGQVLCTFIRRGGLYICKMRLRSPFPGRGM